MTTSTHSTSATHATLSGVRFTRLNEQLDRLSGQGVDILDPVLWHPNTLLVAADLLEQNESKAFMASSRAAMVATSLLTAGDTPQDIDLELIHTDGTTARFTLRFVPTAEKVDATKGLSEEARWLQREEDATLEELMNIPAEKALWVTLDSVEPASIAHLVERFAETTGSTPGSFPSLVGAGAVLAAVQAISAMNAGEARFDYEGFGDEDQRFDHVGVTVTIEEAPKPRSAPKP